MQSPQSDTTKHNDVTTGRGPSLMALVCACLMIESAADICSHLYQLICPLGALLTPALPSVPK